MIEILCSGVSLGHYVPGLLIRERLRALGRRSRIHVYESLIAPERQERIEEAKRSYHQRFEFALAGQRLARHLSPAASQECLAHFLDGWEDAPPEIVVVLSGYWLPVLEAWVAPDASRRSLIELLHIDSTPSPSWTTFAGDGLRHVWLFSWEMQSVVRYLPVGGEVPDDDREKRLVVHGGGWGIGDYRDVVPSLRADGYEVDLVAYFREDIRPERGVHHLVLDADWKPWVTDENGEAVFPPTCDWDRRVAMPTGGRHALYDRIATSVGIVSKPGGATLVDSFASATPCIFLTPYGEHERRNAELWVNLGFGITWDAWRAASFAPCRLETLSRNLIAARGATPSYPDELAARGIRSGP